MPTLLWLGSPPALPVRRALLAAGIELRAVAAGDGHEAAVEVAASTASGARKRSAEPAVGLIAATTGAREPPRLPPSLGGRRWIWWCGARVSPTLVVEAVRRGAHDVLHAGAEGSLALLVARAGEVVALAEESTPIEAPGFVMVRSAAARGVLARLWRAARTSMPVLLTGETGTGKEVCARLVHGWSERRSRPFVPINCAAIPDDLMEAELFGYARGAFSGAVQRYDGQLVAAEGGTVFLDEIEATPTHLQVKLLRVLEDRIVTRIGENQSHKVDFRILAATNRDLGELIAGERFGSDLYERLAIVSIHLPPLRERIEDLPLLVEHFIARYALEEPSAAHARRSRPLAVSPAALAAMAAYPWPGNIRELRNALFETLVDKRVGDEILLSDLPRRLLDRRAPPGAAQASVATAGVVDSRAVTARIAAGTMNLRAEVEELERTALLEALRASDGSPTEAARRLGAVGRGRSTDPGGTVRAMMRRLGIAPA